MHISCVNALSYCGMCNNNGVFGPDKQWLALEECVTQLEESCQIKEGECVELELKLTQVKENLKKSLAGGTLGAPVETKPLGKVQKHTCCLNCTTFKFMSNLIALIPNFIEDSEKWGTIHWVSNSSQLCLWNAKAPPVHLCVYKGKCYAESQGKQTHAKKTKLVSVLWFIYTEQTMQICSVLNLSVG